VAWHAGTQGTPKLNGYGRAPFWRANNINPYSCGVELEGVGADGFPEVQIEACIRVARWLTAAYAIRAEHTFDQIDGHHLHSDLSASRSDPGPNFPLARILAAIRHGA
jgi:N-acetyl-anhydromuramyl-L-alanine amidase AmpD